MEKTKRAWELIPEEKKRKAVQETINFFQNERDEEIGIIAAENILNHFMQEVGIDLYNKGVLDAMKFIKTRFEDIELDMEGLMNK